MDSGILADLRRRHAEPHRAHHGWDRVAGMLARAEEVAAAIADRSAFILAVLFHSAVFDRTRADGPARGVALMRGMLGGAVAAPVLERAEALITAWARQDLPDTEDASLRGDAALLLDMDRAPLGAPPAEFEAHEAAFRAEYAHLKEEAYRAGRGAELRMLLWSERIYRTDLYYLAQEKRARRNIAALLERYGEA